MGGGEFVLLARFVLFFETGSFPVAQAGLKLIFLLPRGPRRGL